MAPVVPLGRRGRILERRSPCHWVFLAALLVSTACSSPRNVSVIDDFRTSERTTLRIFNDLLRRQRGNEIDEIDLANGIDKEVLPRWRDLRARVSAASVPDRDGDLYVVLRRYLAERQHAWEAYTAALRSPTDDAAKPHYARYHALEAAAVDDARRLGQAFRTM